MQRVVYKIPFDLSIQKLHFFKKLRLNGTLILLHISGSVCYNAEDARKDAAGRG